MSGEPSLPSSILFAKDIFNAAEDSSLGIVAPMPESRPKAGGSSLLMIANSGCLLSMGIDFYSCLPSYVYGYCLKDAQNINVLRP